MSELKTTGKITEIKENGWSITEIDISEHKSIFGIGINGRMKIMMDKEATFQFTQLAVKQILGKQYKAGNHEFILKKLKETLEGKTIEITIK